MQRLIAAFASLVLVFVAGFGLFGMSPAAQAQVVYPAPVSVTCRAESPNAYGVWTHANGSYACKRALEECAARTPSYQTCYVTRWWYNF